MDARRLTHQANQIARFFEAQGEEAAVAGVEDHLRKFWDPRMRAQLLAHLAAGGEGLSPLARAGAERLETGSEEAGVPGQTSPQRGSVSKRSI